MLSNNQAKSSEFPLRKEPVPIISEGLGGLILLQADTNNSRKYIRQSKWIFILKLIECIEQPIPPTPFAKGESSPTGSKK